MGDTLARKLMTNGEKGHELNFPNDDTEVFPEKKKFLSQFVGVVYNIKGSKWQARRYIKHEKRILYNGSYDNEERAARASDTLARKLIINGEKGHKLNFPNDETEVFQEKRQRKRKRTHHEDLCHPKNN